MLKDSSSLNIYMMSRSFGLLFTMAVVTVSFLAAGVTGVAGMSLHRRQISDNSRLHCQTETQGTCYFYSHCIEKLFPCGKDGFVLSYALKRCNNINKLIPRRRGCSRCVSPQTHTWVHYSEQCFQNKLKVLLESYYNKRISDPQTCLDWEREAIAEMNKCYNDTRSGYLLHNLPAQDITRLVINISRTDTDTKYLEYYGTAIDSGLPQMLKDHELGTSLITTPLKHRIVLCIKGAKYHAGSVVEVEASPEDYIRAALSKLNYIPIEDLHYGGKDEDEDGLCTDHQPISINSNTYTYHLLTWFTTNSTQQEIDATSIMYTNKIKNVYFSGAMYELTGTKLDSNKPPRVPSQCGDGKRQATEACDYTYDNYDSCTIDCEVRNDYDCNGERLEKSKCWREDCGDGLRTRGEKCDDGNTDNGDGCSSTCQVETTTHKCTQTYNETSECTHLIEANKYHSIPPAKLTSQSTHLADPITRQDRTFPSPKQITSAAGSKPLVASLTMTLLVGFICSVVSFLR